MNTAILVSSSFTIHYALESIRRGNRTGLKLGLVAHLAAGRDLPLHPDQRVRPHRLQRPRPRLRLDLLQPHRPARRPRLRRADAAQLRRRSAPSAATSARRRRTTSASRCRHLLALRRRHVDRRLHHRLHPLAAQHGGRPLRVPGTRAGPVGGRSPGGQEEPRPRRSSPNGCSMTRSCLPLAIAGRCSTRTTKRWRSSRPPRSMSSAWGTWTSLWPTRRARASRAWPSGAAPMRASGPRRCFPRLPANLAGPLNDDAKVVVVRFRLVRGGD